MPIEKTKWRYMHLTVDSNTGTTENELDRLGEQGWEVVGFQVVGVGSNRDYVYLLKLPIGTTP